MKGKIIAAEFSKEGEGKFGKWYSHRITIEHEGEKQICNYLSKTKEQTKFIAGQDAEYTLTEKEYNGKTYFDIKPVQDFQGKSNFGKKLAQEQSKYSGFAMSYAKDLTISGVIKADQMFATAKKMFDWMVDQDKNLQQ
jgi:hypothetical protein